MFPSFSKKCSEIIGSNLARPTEQRDSPLVGSRLPAWGQFLWSEYSWRPSLQFGTLSARRRGRFCAPVISAATLWATIELIVRPHYRFPRPFSTTSHVTPTGCYPFDALLWRQLCRRDGLFVHEIDHVATATGWRINLPRRCRAISAAEIATHATEKRATEWCGIMGWHEIGSPRLAWWSPPLAEGDSTNHQRL